MLIYNIALFVNSYKWLDKTSQFSIQILQWCHQGYNDVITAAFWMLGILSLYVNGQIKGAVTFTVVRWIFMGEIQLFQ